MSGELIISFLTIYNEQDLKARSTELELISPFPLPVAMFSSVLEDFKPECSGPKSGCVLERYLIFQIPVPL